MRLILSQTASNHVKRLPCYIILSQCSPKQSRSFTAITTRTYDDAIDLLNTLQTPFSVLDQRRKAGIGVDVTANGNLLRCLACIGYSQSDLTKLNIVHVAGTKGKGTTCAYIDSILAQYRISHSIPTKIGLFTSPHLIAVRERIRINSVPISRVLFAKYFFEVWDLLHQIPSPSPTPIQHEPPAQLEIPVYFRYLTLLSYHVFLSENVEVAIYETGMGGEHDATNVVERPTVTGISALGIDHTFLLGNTIEEIAWHKAGIQKRGVPSFTVEQVPSALRVVEARAEERGVGSFDVVREDGRLKGQGVRVQPAADFQVQNASLAIVLAETVLRKLDPGFKAVKGGKLGKEFVDGIEKVVWRGRCETKVEGNITWFLDGAHTVDSIAIASKWFGDAVENRTGTRVLIFNQQGDREPIPLLERLYTAIGSRFDHVVFCTTASRPDVSQKDFINSMSDTQAITSLSMQKAFANRWRTLQDNPDVDSPTETKIEVLPYIEDALDYVRALDKGGDEEIDVLITGSVHLVGRALGVLEGVDAL